MRRIAALDLLRGLAAFAVAIPHFLLYHRIGGAQLEAVAAIAVEVFFALSGFVLGHQILLCVAVGGRSYRIFLIRRWMRTVPPYIVALVLASMLSGMLLSGHFLAYLFYVQNLLPMPQADDYYAVAWSLSVEEWFYISFPVVVLAASRLAGRRGAGFCALAAVGFIGAVSLARILHGDGGNWGFEVRRVVVFRVNSIAYGFLLYLAVQRLKFRSAGTQAALAIAAAAGALAAFAAADRTLLDGAPGRQLFPFVAALFGVLLVLAFHLGERWIGRSRAVAAFCEYLGRISYSIYLFHSTALILLGPGLPETATGVRFAIYLALIAAFASAFYWWFERPILAARPRFRTPTGEPVSATAEPALPR